MSLHPPSLICSLTSLLFQMSLQLCGKLRLGSELLVPRFNTESENTFFSCVSCPSTVCATVSISASRLLEVLGFRQSLKLLCTQALSTTLVASLQFFRTGNWVGGQLQFIRPILEKRWKYDKYEVSPTSKGTLDWDQTCHFFVTVSFPVSLALALRSPRTCSLLLPPGIVAAPEAGTSCTKPLSWQLIH